MAKVSIKMPDEFLLRISRLGDQIDVIAPRVLEVGGKVVLEKVKVIFEHPLARELNSHPGQQASSSHH